MIVQNPSELLKKKKDPRNLAGAIQTASNQPQTPPPTPTKPAATVKAQPASSDTGGGYFDLDRARQDKVPDEQIAKHLAGQVGFDVEKARKDNVPWNVIADELATKYNEGKSKGWKASDIAPNRSVGEYAKDMALNLGQGIAGFGPSVLGVADILTTLSPTNIGRSIYAKAKGEKFVPETPTKFLRETVGYRPEAVSELFQQAQSKGAKESLRDIASTSAESWKEQGLAVLRNPMATVNDFIRSLPQMYLGGAMGKAMGLSPIAAGAFGEATGQAGSMAEEIQREKGLTPTRALFSAASGAIDALLSAVSGRIAKKLGVTDIDTLFGGGKAAKYAKNRATKALLGAVQEGWFEELGQGAQEAMWMNAAMGKPIMEGVPQEAIRSAAAGSFGGGAIQLAGLEGEGEKKKPAPERTPEERYRTIQSLATSNIPDEQLQEMANNPEQYGVDPVDINGALKVRQRQKTEQAGEMVNQYPDDHGPLTRVAKDTVEGQQAQEGRITVDDVAPLISAAMQPIESPEQLGQIQQAFVEALFRPELTSQARKALETQAQQLGIDTEAINQQIRAGAVPEWRIRNQQEIEQAMAEAEAETPPAAPGQPDLTTPEGRQQEINRQMPEGEVPKGAPAVTGEGTERYQAMVLLDELESVDKNNVKAVNNVKMKIAKFADQVGTDDPVAARVAVALADKAGVTVPDQVREAAKGPVGKAEPYSPELAAKTKEAQPALPSAQAAEGEGFVMREPRPGEKPPLPKGAVTRKDGSPFKTEAAARRVLNRQENPDNFAIRPHEGGFALIPKEALGTVEKARTQQEAGQAEEAPAAQGKAEEGTAAPEGKVKPEPVPKLTESTESVEFGKTATPGQIETLKQKYFDSVKRSKELQAEGKPDEAMKVIQEGSYAREALHGAGFEVNREPTSVDDVIAGKLEGGKPNEPELVKGKEETEKVGNRWPDHVAEIDKAPTERAKTTAFMALGQRAVPGIRLQDAEEAGKIAYMVEKGQIAPEELDKFREMAVRENRISQGKKKGYTEVPIMTEEEIS